MAQPNPLPYTNNGNRPKAIPRADLPFHPELKPRSQQQSRDTELPLPSTPLLSDRERYQASKQVQMLPFDPSARTRTSSSANFQASLQATRNQKAADAYGAAVYRDALNRAGSQELPPNLRFPIGAGPTEVASAGGLDSLPLHLRAPGMSRSATTQPTAGQPVPQLLPGVMPTTVATGTTTTLPDGRVVPQYVDSPAAKAARAEAFVARNKAKADLSLMLPGVMPGAPAGGGSSATDETLKAHPYPGAYFQSREHAADENARANTETAAAAGLDQANAQRVQARTPYETDQLAAETARTDAQTQGLAQDQAFQRDLHPHEVQGAQIGNQQRQLDLDQDRAGVGQPQIVGAGQDPAKVEAFYTGLMRQSQDEMRAASKAGDKAALADAHRRWKDARDQLNAFRRQAAGIPDPNGQQQQAQGRPQGQAMRLQNGRIVYRQPDGSFIDDQGRPIRQ